MAWGIASASTPGIRPVRVYPVQGSKDLDFVCQIQSQFPFIIASDTNAVITSGMTQGGT